MRSALILSALAAVGMVAAWLFAGRQLVLVVDRFARTRAESLPAGPLIYSPGTMKVGDYPLETSLPDGRPADLRVDVDAGGRRLVLQAGGKVFPLGPRLGPPDRSGRPDIAFAPDPDDEVAFSVERSLLAWPTPFDINFMTGTSSSWRRNLYYRLAWRKPSGAVLDMIWRYEQWFYDVDGWGGEMMTKQGATGLVHVGIVAKAAAADAGSVKAYLARTKGWTRDDDRLESHGVSADGCCDVLRAIHRSDAAGAQPGGGRAFELHIDRATRRVGNPSSYFSARGLAKTMGPRVKPAGDAFFETEATKIRTP